MAEEIKDGRDGERKVPDGIYPRLCTGMYQKGNVWPRITDRGGVGCSMTMADVSREEV